MWRWGCDGGFVGGSVVLGFLTDNTTMPTKFLYLVDGWVVAIHLGLDAMELC